MDVARLGTACRGAVLELLVDGGEERVASEEIRGGRCLIRPTSCRTRYGVVLEGVRGGGGGAYLEHPRTEGIVAVGGG